MDNLYLALSQKLTIKKQKISKTAGIFVVALAAMFFPAKLLAQAPALSYSGPVVDTTFVPANPIVPVSSNVTAPGYTLPGQALGTGLYEPLGVTVDANGNKYITDGGTGNIVRISSTGVQTVLTGTAKSPVGIAISNKGIIYYTDVKYNYIYKEGGVGSTSFEVIGQATRPNGIAVDTAGNVYVADENGNSIIKISKNLQRKVIGHFPSPNGIAVDIAGNVYVSGDTTVIVKFPANSGPPVSLGGGITGSHGLAIDGAGNLYYSNNNSILMELPAGGGTPIAISSGFNGAGGVAVDNKGVLYICDIGDNVIQKIIPKGGYYISPMLPPGLTINNTTGTIGGTPTTISLGTVYTVTGYNGNTPGSANIKITVVKNRAIASLKGLSISPGNLKPVFMTDTTTYTGYASVSQIKVQPTATFDGETIKVNGAVVASGKQSGFIQLAPGPNVVTTTVTSVDGLQTRTYTLNITRLPQSAANLSFLKISSGTLSPGFNAATTFYYDTVARTVATVRITPTLINANSTVTVKGVTVASGSPSAPLYLAAGDNFFSVLVTAEDSVTTKNYLIDVYHPPFATNDSLTNITLTTGTLNPAFNPGTYFYNAYVDNSHTSIKMKPVKADSYSSIITKVNDNTVTADNNGIVTVPLNPGNNSVDFSVTAQDGSTVQDYQVNVTRLAPNPANLSGLTIANGTLSPAFSQGTTHYTVQENNAVHQTSVTATLKDPSAALTINGSPATSGVAVPVRVMARDTNTFVYISVKAQDSVTIKTYIIDIYNEDSAGPTGGISSVRHTTHPDAANDGVMVHPALSVNGDGINDHLIVDGLDAYPKNKISIMTKSGSLVYQADNYDNRTRAFDGHSSTDKKLQQPGVYYYVLQYEVNGEQRKKSGYIVLKY